MENKGKSKRRLAWQGTCLICKAALDFAYTATVALLALLVAAFALIVFLDESEMPDFLLRALERKLQAQGASLSMSAIRIQPSGRISIEDPVIHSEELQSVIARADHISLKLNPALLLFGKLRFSELDIFDGSLFTPALLSPSGLSEPVIRSIDLRAENQLNGWRIGRAKFRFADIRGVVTGIIDFNDLPLEERPPQETPQTLIQQLIGFHKAIQQAKTQLEAIEGAEARIQIEAPRGEKKSLHAQIGFDRATWKDRFAADGIRIELDAWHDQYARAVVTIDRAEGPESIVAERLRIESAWETSMNPKDWLPTTALLSVDSIGQEEELVTHLSLEAAPMENGNWQSSLTLALKNASLSMQALGNPQTLTGSVAIAGVPTKELVEFASEQAMPYVARFAPQAQAKLEEWPIASYASIIDAPYVEAHAIFDGAAMPTQASAFLDVGRIVSRGAVFDRAIAQAHLKGRSLEVSNLWLRSESQEGWMSLGLDLDTLQRRILIDGMFNPRLIDSWIPDDWWTEFWDNFIFPENGFYCIMDSSQIIKRPDTLRITGYGIGDDLMVRGHPMRQIELRMFILQRYFDLYDIVLSREEGDARGEAQFAIAPDPRDGKFKMTGLWIDAETNIELSIGPDLISEVRQDVVDILEPYGYETPPRVKAKSSSVRVNDLYEYSIDLQIDTDEWFSYYHFPLDSVHASVQLGNGWASLPEISADLAGGKVEANAEIVDEEINLELTLSNARFGSTLNAAAIYFRENDDSSSASEFTSEELESYGGSLETSFKGTGIVGDSQSFLGKGSYRISGADLHDIPLLGGISRILERANLPIATLKFEDSHGDFDVDKRYIRFPELKLVGPVAQIQSDGNYDIEEGDLDFKAKLFPFRSMPLIQIPGRVLDIFTGIFELRIRGTIAEPQLSLFDAVEAPKTAPASPETGAGDQSDPNDDIAPRN